MAGFAVILTCVFFFFTTEKEERHSKQTFYINYCIFDFIQVGNYIHKF